MCVGSHYECVRPAMMDMYHATGVSEVALTLSATNTPVTMRPFAFAPVMLLVAVSDAQNLVPNSGFEAYSICPDLYNQMDYSTGWSAYRGSPDYFNSCDSSGIVGVPNNFAGNQSAADGEAYAGVLAWSLGVEDEREYLGAELIAPLVPGIPVYISFKISGATGGSQNDFRWTCNGGGVLFTMSPYSQSDPLPIPNNGALYTSSAPLDTLNWTEVNGIYVPDSTYQYVTLGNLLSDNLLTLEEFNPAGNDNRVYLLFDDVCVSLEAATCHIEESVAKNILAIPMVSPNPFSNETVVRWHEGMPGMDIWLTDIMGRRVWSTHTQEGQTSFRIDGSVLAGGAYLLMGGSFEGLFPITKIFRVSP